jgi:hypothetical protein
MKEQHLSDEAIAAFADDVLRGHARERAGRHTARCAECKYAVAVQREAVWALRATPAPSLPNGLLDRLREVPSTTELNTVPSTFAPDGSAMFAAFGSMSMSAAAVASDPESEGKKSARIRPFVLSTAAVAVASVVALSGSSYFRTDDAPAHSPAHTQPATDEHPVRLAHLLEPTRLR